MIKKFCPVYRINLLFSFVVEKCKRDDYDMYTLYFMCKTFFFSSLSVSFTPHPSPPSLPPLLVKKGLRCFVYTEPLQKNHSLVRWQNCTKTYSFIVRIVRCFLHFLLVHTNSKNFRTSFTCFINYKVRPKPHQCVSVIICTVVHVDLWHVVKIYFLFLDRFTIKQLSLKSLV